MSQCRNMVVMGGGTGTFTVLSGLKHYVPEIGLTAIVGASDSGGSTGRLRDEFGHLPVGDARMALVALADGNGPYGELLRKLFLYRFDKGGKDLEGHNFGNLFLTALTEIVGSEAEAIRVAGKVLRVAGKVYSVADTELTLVARYADGRVVRGEAEIDMPPRGSAESRIAELTVEPHGTISEPARSALAAADTIILGPGDLYTSVLATCVVGGVPEVLRAAKGKLIHVSNLMTRYGQTSGFGVAEHVREIEKYIGRMPDAVLINTAPLPDDLLARYAQQGELPLADNTDTIAGVHIVRGDFLAREEVTTERGDVVRRSFIRHDPEKLAAAIRGL